MASFLTAAAHNVVSSGVTKYLLPGSIAYTLTFTDTSGGLSEFTLYSPAADQIIPQLEDLFQSQEEPRKKTIDCSSEPIKY